MSLRPAISWLIILASIFYFVFEASPSISDPSAAINLSTPQFTLQSRYILGIHSLFSSLPKRAPEQDTSFVNVITQAAKTPIERLRLAPVLGELQGKEAALEQLDKITPELHDPDLQRDAMLFRAVYSSSPETLSPRDREILIARHDFFAKLVLTFGKPSTDPARAQVLAAAKRTAIAAISIIVLGIVGLVVGLAILIVAIVLFATGKLRPHFIPESRPTARYLESFAFYLVAMILLSLLFRYLFPVRGLWSSSILLLLVPLCLAWPACKFGIPAMARALGFIPGATLGNSFTSPLAPSGSPGLLRRVLTEVLCGIAGYLAGLPLLAVGLLLTLILSRFAHATPEHPIIHAVGRSPRLTFQLYLLACLVAPMVEETFFRGALYIHLRSRMSWIPSALVTAAIFAIIHPQGWTTLPVLAAIGFTLATLREWRHSLLASMTAHALNNFVATTFLTLALS